MEFDINRLFFIFFFQNREDSQVDLTPIRVEIDACFLQTDHRKPLARKETPDPDVCIWNAKSTP